jgi:multimeric flavodoxin WrbA/putative sterol carrier protein
MGRAVEAAPLAAFLVYLLLGKISHFHTATMRAATVLILLALIPCLWLPRRWRQASPIHRGFGGFLVLAALAVWLWPGHAGKWMAEFPAAALNGVLCLVAVVPLLLGRPGFTTFFAKRVTPAAVWETDLFLTINRHLTAFWAVLFLLGTALGLIPGLLDLRGPLYEPFFEALVPAALMLGIGVPVTRRYPEYRQRKLGIAPAAREPDRPVFSPPGVHRDVKRTGTDETTSHHAMKEEREMSPRPVVVAVNGSPHGGFGNTAQMIEMLRAPLEEAGLDLEVIHLGEHEMAFCTGCAFCMEKGACWIDDDHRTIVRRLLDAAGVVLASPVYFLHVTAQMKTFLDRSLAYGHKPRATWKPGLAVSVSAGLGETATADYLAFLLRTFGAYSVGSLTALAVAPGGFVGKDAVEARARDLGGDLARAILEKRRYPVTDRDLRYYQFMGALVRSQKDSIMRDDFAHWEKHGLYEGFEQYVQQAAAPVPDTREMREAWVRQMIADQRERKKGRAASRQPALPSGPQAAQSCRELLGMMPQALNPDAAAGLDATYQFEVTGAETFVAHLRIRGGACTYREGPADRAGVVIKTPSDVWLAISRGELDGQQAFMAGKYKVEGDLTLLMKLRSLFAP